MRNALPEMTVTAQGESGVSKGNRYTEVRQPNIDAVLNHNASETPLTPMNEGVLGLRF